MDHEFRKVKEEEDVENEYLSNNFWKLTLDTNREDEIFKELLTN